MLAHGKHLFVIHGYGILEYIINMAYVDQEALVNPDEAVRAELLFQGTDGACKCKCAFLCNHTDGP